MSNLKPTASFHKLFNLKLYILELFLMARNSVIHSNSKQFMLAVFMNYVIISSINENTSTVKIQEPSCRTTNILVTWTKEKNLKAPVY